MTAWSLCLWAVLLALVGPKSSTAAVVPVTHDPADVLAEGSNPITKAEPVHVASVANGKRFAVYLHAGDAEPALRLLHLYGTTAEMGTAYGALMADEIKRFVTTDFRQYLVIEVKSLVTKLHKKAPKLPAWLLRFIEDEADKYSYDLLLAACRHVLGIQRPDLVRSLAQPLVELKAMAGALCAHEADNADSVSQDADACDVDQWASLLQAINLFPEVIEMQCSMAGMWGRATPDGKLVQLRTLDFGGGPFADASTLVVYHPSQGLGHTFANLAFPGFVGTITGFSTHIGLSEKIWLITGASGPQPGSYHGEAVVQVSREVLQFANDTASAMAMMQARQRTFAVFLGIGDYATGEMHIAAYRRQDLTVYSSTTMPSLTSQPAIEDVIYVDKHPQPSHSPVMSTFLRKHHGSLSGHLVASRLPLAEQSGDVHLAVYDFGQRTAYIAVGRWNATNASYGPNGMAFQQPVLEFAMDALWREPEPVPAPSSLV